MDKIKDYCRNFSPHKIPSNFYNFICTQQLHRDLLRKYEGITEKKGLFG